MSKSVLVVSGLYVEAVSILVIENLEAGLYLR